MFCTFCELIPTKSVLIVPCCTSAMPTTALPDISMHLQGLAIFRRMCRVLSARNRNWKQKERDAAAHAPLQEAWAQSTLPDYIHDNVRIEQRIHVASMHAASRGHKPSSKVRDCLMLTL